MTNDGKITEIVSKEALEQIDQLNIKLEKCLMLEKNLGNNVTSKIKVLKELYENINLSTALYNKIDAKLMELIPLL
jgi:hypothetical protein